MVKLKFYLIPSAEKMLEMVRQSHGQIFMPLPDKTIRDLKLDVSAQQFLEHEVHQGRAVELHIFDTKDCSEFINFMMGAAYD